MGRLQEIDRFQKYVERGEVKQREENPSQQESLVERAESKFANMEKLGISEDTATDYLETVYDAVKMLIQSFMASGGWKPYSHEAVIAYAIDELEVDMVEANSLNKYRKLRNDIVYRGETATEKEAEDIRQLYKRLKSELEIQGEENE